MIAHDKLHTNIQSVSRKTSIALKSVCGEFSSIRTGKLCSKNGPKTIHVRGNLFFEKLIFFKEHTHCTFPYA